MVVRGRSSDETCGFRARALVIFKASAVRHSA